MTNSNRDKRKNGCHVWKWLAEEWNGSITKPVPLQMCTTLSWYAADIHATLLTLLWTKWSEDMEWEGKGGGVGGGWGRRGGASSDYRSCNLSGHWSEVEGGTGVKNREGRVTWDSDLNPRDPAGKYNTDPCVYTESLRFTACINTPHTVLYMVVSVLISCMCMSGSLHR